MYRYFISLALSALLACTVLAQEGLSRSHPKHKTTRKVLKNLIRAIGDGGRTKPRLQVQPRGRVRDMRVTWFNREQNEVVLEERVYDLCASLGPDSLDALASLLGHELAHYYKDHDWVGDFGNGFANLEVGKMLRKRARADSTCPV